MLNNIYQFVCHDIRKDFVDNYIWPGEFTFKK